MSRYHDGLRLAVIRSSSGRTESAPPEILSRGLTRREKERLRSQGFTEAEVAFLNALAEIRDFFERLEAKKGAPSPESASAASGRQSAMPGWTPTTSAS